MTHPEPTMTPGQMASLLDFLNATVRTLRMVGREKDGTTTAWIGCLLAEEEVEILMGLRAAWLRGEDRSLAEAVQTAAKARLGVE